MKETKIISEYDGINISIETIMEDTSNSSCDIMGKLSKVLNISDKDNIINSNIIIELNTKYIIVKNYENTKFDIKLDTIENNCNIKPSEKDLYESFSYFFNFLFQEYNINDKRYLTSDSIINSYEQIKHYSDNYFNKYILDIFVHFFMLFKYMKISNISILEISDKKDNILDYYPKRYINPEYQENNFNIHFSINSSKLKNNNKYIGIILPNKSKINLLFNIEQDSTSISYIHYNIYYHDNFINTFWDMIIVDNEDKNSIITIPINLKFKNEEDYLKLRDNRINMIKRIVDVLK